MVVVILRLRLLVVNTAARSVKEVNTAAVERSWREAFAAASPAQVRNSSLAGEQSLESTPSLRRIKLLSPICSPADLARHRCSQLCTGQPRSEDVCAAGQQEN